MKKAIRNTKHTPFHEEADSEGSWAISYGDMVTLLLCFFILFFTIDPKKDQTSALQQALLSVLLKESASPNPEAGRSPATVGDQSAAGQSHLKAEAQAQGRLSSARGNDKVVELKSEEVEKWGGKIHKMGSRIVIEFPGVSFFDSGGIKVTKKGEENLKRFIGMYMPFVGSNILAVQAYTDMKKVIPLPGRKFSDNLELSALRSVATVRILQHAGIPLNRMKVSGYGEMKVTARELASLYAAGNPSDGSSTQAAYDLARKVVLVIQPEGKVEP